MRKNLLKVLFFCVFVSCSKDGSHVYDVPECLKSTVVAIQKKPAQEPRAKIEKWKYEGQEVYFIDAQNFPDGEIFVITLDCQETICTFGGIDGPDNDCENWENAVYIETIWLDMR